MGIILYYSISTNIFYSTFFHFHKVNHLHSSSYVIYIHRLFLSAKWRVGDQDGLIMWLGFQREIVCTECRYGNLLQNVHLEIREVKECQY